ncbi:MAG: hypothetical protein J3Q66DRAFT_37924 [Benniella sp.]|nr:MAG: hypothetical protein J3Q66DRAFT_37924 [Benniella sp.]
MAEEQKDWYTVLGVERTATTKEITKAYRKKALKYHPDKNPSPSAEKIFEDVSKAYEVLGDPVTRAAFDNKVNIKVQAIERTERYDSARKKMKEDLERRESEFKQQQQAEKEAALKMQYEAERLKQETIKKEAEREAELMRQAEQMSEAAQAARKAAIDKEIRSLDTTLRIKWKGKKHVFETDELSNIFKSYGEIDSCLSKKQGSAVITFRSIKGAYAAMKAFERRDKGLEVFTISWATGEEPASVRSKATPPITTTTTAATPSTSVSTPRTHFGLQPAFNVSTSTPYIPNSSSAFAGAAGASFNGFPSLVPSFAAPSTFLDDYEAATLAKLKNKDNERKRLAEEMMRQDQEEEELLQETKAAEEEVKDKKQKV